MDIIKAEKSEKLSRAVGRLLPSVSYAYLQKLLRKKDVKVNGKRVSDDILVNMGDEVILYTSDEKKSAFSPEVLYRDDNIIVCVKPKGIASVGEHSFEERLKTALDVPYLALAHRLDTNTEGLQLVALSENVFNALASAFKAGEIDKKYAAIVMGQIVGKGILKGYILKCADESRVMVCQKQKEGALSAVTEYQTITNYDGATKVEVVLKTGRTHQIRAHFASIEHPVLGDGKYGDYAFNAKFNEKSQALKAFYLKINIKKGVLAYLNGKTFKIDSNFEVEKKLISLT